MALTCSLDPLLSTRCRETLVDCRSLRDELDGHHRGSDDDLGKVEQKELVQSHDAHNRQVGRLEDVVELVEDSSAGPGGQSLSFGASPSGAHWLEGPHEAEA